MIRHPRDTVTRCTFGASLYKAWYMLLACGGAVSTPSPASTDQALCKYPASIFLGACDGQLAVSSRSPPLPRESTVSWRLASPHRRSSIAWGG